MRFDDLVEVMLCDQQLEAVGKITMNDLQQWGHKPWGPIEQSDDDLSLSIEPDPGHPSQWVDRLKRLVARNTLFHKFDGRLQPQLRGTRSAGTHFLAARGELPQEHPEELIRRVQTPADQGEPADAESDPPHSADGDREDVSICSAVQSEEEGGQIQDHLVAHQLATLSGSPAQNEEEAFSVVAEAFDYPEEDFRTVIDIPSAILGSGATQVLISELLAHRPPHDERGALVLVEVTLHARIFRRFRDAIILPSTSITRQQLLALIGRDQDCRHVEDRCLVWHDRRLWHSNDGDPRPIQQGAFLQIAIPPGDGESQAMFVDDGIHNDGEVNQDVFHESENSYPWSQASSSSSTPTEALDIGEQPPVTAFHFFHSSSWATRWR